VSSNITNERKPDLPRWLLQLARQIARDCRSPGTYHIVLTVPHHRGQIRQSVIERVERIRVVEDRDDK